MSVFWRSCVCFDAWLGENAKHPVSILDRRLHFRDIPRTSINRQAEFFCQADIGIGALGCTVDAIHRIALPYQAIRDRVQERFADRIAQRFGTCRSR